MDADSVAHDDRCHDDDAYDDAYDEEYDAEEQARRLDGDHRSHHLRDHQRCDGGECEGEGGSSDAAWSDDVASLARALFGRRLAPTVASAVSAAARLAAAAAAATREVGARLGLCESAATGALRAYQDELEHGSRPATALGQFNARHLDDGETRRRLAREAIAELVIEAAEWKVGAAAADAARIDGDREDADEDVQTL